MRSTYEECLRIATRYARDRSEASDLVQTVFLQALERGVSELSAPERRAWLRGALRRRAAFEARVAGRRRKREQHWADLPHAGTPASAWRFSPELLAQLQPSVRALATLAAADLNPDEIRFVLRLSGTAFRKRLSVLGRFVREAAEAGLSVIATPGAVYALGPARASLIQSMRLRPQSVLGSHDPDGHPLIFALRGEKVAHTSDEDGNTET